MGIGSLFGRGRKSQPGAGHGESPLAPSHGSQPAPSTVRSQRGTATWVPSGGTIVVDGRSIPGGMFYVGSGASSVDGQQIEPCLIDPRLPVAWKRPDLAGSTMGYWPSYDRLDKRARAAYLRWLMEGRRSGSAYIGYVFLFFYGLERRLLIDHGAGLDHPEVAMLVDEIEGLLGVYGDNRSFSGYAGSLLEFVEALRSVNADLQPVLWDPDHGSWEVPAAVRIGVGKLVAEGARLPAEWALSYLRYHPEVYLRTAAVRCLSEFDELFVMRYRSRFGDGIKVRKPAKTLEFVYRPASGGFVGSATRKVKDIPDITSVVGPLNKLKDLAEECTDELDSYSRLLGRRPAEAGTAAAIALLPDDLLAGHGGPVFEGMRSWTMQMLAGKVSVVVPLDEVVREWSPGRTEKLAKRDAVSLASLLGKIGVGIEPDVRFGASTPKPGSDAVLFPLPEEAAAAPSPEYTAAMSLVHLTAVVAAADGLISPAEQQHLAAHAEQVLGLDAAERVRLEAHLEFLATGKLGMAGTKRRVEALPAEERAAVGRFLIDVAAADGVVSPEEISTLTKVFGHLSLDEADVYRQVHALGTGETGPVTVRKAQPATRWAVPEPVADAPQPAAVVLDPAKVKARLAETARVTALLTDIFAEDDDPATAPPPGRDTEASAPEPLGDGPAVALRIDGLDSAHSALAAALTGRQEWNRSDIEELAHSLGLPLLEGAFDVINEAAIDACGEPLVEGDDPVGLNAYALEELL
ncbi:MAG: TerB N-terminal domain-containing protein [bacterium]|nr:TerB N-terminal domain-containing protein [bacterium]